MKKRKIIILCSLAAVLIILIGTFGALFNLKYIYVEVLSNPAIVESYGSSYKEDIVESGEFAYGSNVLFCSYTPSSEKIEKAFPFVKVEKMVRRFPNKLTVYVSGRIPELVIKDDDIADKWYIVDYDMKVLSVIRNEVDLSDNMYRDLPIVSVKGVNNLSAGDFLEASILTNTLINILDGVYGESASPSSVMSRITLDISSEKCDIILDDVDSEGATISISGFAYMKEKVYVAYHHYRTNYENDDVAYPNKSDLVLLVGNDFVPEVNERIVEHDKRNDV